MPLAALPMYDWPEIRRETDRLWAKIAAELRDDGIDTPERLTRDDHDLMALWRNPDLLFGQTCGFPLATTLSGAVCLVGTPAYALDCPAGHYFSVIVTRPQPEPGRTHVDAPPLRLAVNGRDSQSGFRAPMRWFSERRSPLPAVIETGSHRASIRAVAEGQADLAAIDAVTWRLALRHEPAARMLVVQAETPPTPALPFITARAHAALAARLRAAAARAIAGLEATTRQALLLTGIVETTVRDYAALRTPIAGLDAPIDR